MKFNEIIKNLSGITDFISLTYSKKHNVTIVSFNTKYGILLRLLRGQRRPKLVKKVRCFFDNNKTWQTYRYFFGKKPCFSASFSAVDFNAALDNLFYLATKNGTYRNNEFYKSIQDYPVEIISTHNGSILNFRTFNKSKQVIRSGFNSLVYRDLLNTDISIDLSSLGFFADIIAPYFKGTCRLYYDETEKRCMLKNKNTVFIPCRYVYRGIENYSFNNYLSKKPVVRYCVKNVKALKSAIEKACSNTYGLGGKKASLYICLDFTEGELSVYSYNKMTGKSKVETIKNEKINPGYITDRDDITPLSRLYLDANTIKELFETIAENSDAVNIDLSNNGIDKYRGIDETKQATISTSFISYQTVFKTEKDIRQEEQQTREEDIKDIKQDLSNLTKKKNTLENKIQSTLDKIGNCEKTIETIKNSIYKEPEKGKRKKSQLTKTDYKDIRANYNKILRYKDKLNDIILKGKKNKGYKTLLQEVEKEINRVTQLLYIMNNSNLSLAQSVYAYNTYKGSNNKKRDKEGKIIIINGEPVYKRTIDEIIKNAVTSEKDNSLDLALVFDWEREQQEKINVSLLEEELKEHKLLLKEEKARAKKEEGKRRQEARIAREKARQEKKQQEEKAREEKRLAREKEREERLRRKQEEKAQKRQYRKYDPLDYIIDLDKKTELLDNYQPQEIKVDIPDYSVKKPYNNYVRQNINKQENNLIYALVGYSLLGSITAAITALVLYIL